MSCEEPQQADEQKKNGNAKEQYLRTDLGKRATEAKSLGTSCFFRSKRLNDLGNSRTFSSNRSHGIGQEANKDGSAKQCRSRGHDAKPSLRWRP